MIYTMPRIGDGSNLMWIALGIAIMVAGVAVTVVEKTKELLGGEK